MLTSTVTAQDLGEITNLRSTRQESRKVVLTWDEVPDAAEYVVYRHPDLKILDVGHDNWAVIDDLSPATQYSFEVEALGGDNATLAFSTVIDVATTVAKRIANFRSTRQEQRLIVLTWDKVHNVDSYHVYFNDNPHEVADVGNDNWAVISDLRPGTTYEFNVRAIVDDPDVGPRPVSTSAPISVATAPIPGVTRSEAPEVVNTFVDNSAVVLRMTNKKDSIGNPVASQYVVLRNETPIFVKATNQLDYTWFVDQVDPGTTNSYYVVVIDQNQVSGHASETLEITSTR